MRWLARRTDPAHTRAEAHAWLIVNADDFGASPGVNSGILEAHRCGIVTSTSLLVNRPWSREAAMAARSVPSLSVGLHVELVEGLGHDTIARPKLLRDALRGQIAKFERLMGRAPTHLDSHCDAHEESIAGTEFLQVARSRRLALRGFSPIRALRRFYAGTAHLVDVLSREVRAGVTELVCHPGHIDTILDSRYRVERVLELKALCSPGARATLLDRSIRLIRHEDVARLFR
jgi:predicted glycoside hydrolase/deacetylase ChbG (UPF0249 family)